MTDNDDRGDGLFQAAAAAHVRAAPRQHYLKTPACPPITRFSAPELPEWSGAELAHVESCPYCQKLLNMRFRQDCPGIADLIRFRAGSSPYKKALESHLEEEQCQRCQTVLDSAWMTALAQTWRAGAPVLQRLRDWARETAIGSAGLAMQPEFASPTDSPAFRITAGDAAGSMLATLIDERSQAVLYIEARGEAMVNRRAYVDVFGPKGRVSAVVELEQIGKSATGVYRFGPTAGLIAAAGDTLTLFVGLEPQ
jgi:hypothetical protein